MPCDPYTESGYFEAIGKMVRVVEKNIADLVLMGIRPTYPSAKYGYVVPDLRNQNEADWYPVRRFVEKPSVEVAEQLLSKNALWNGGVFAFRLGYMMRIVGTYMPLCSGDVGQIHSFKEVQARYHELPKISFDYEVAEKAHSVAVIPFLGQWKDLGTWNTLTDELSRHAIGNVTLGPKCENTHIINELQNPIFVDGVKDIVVAACPDGILVCAKKETENIKKYVENLTPRPMYEERRWGTYRVLDDTRYEDGGHSLTKSITMLPGRCVSYQLHHHRSETWTFVEGEGIFVLDGIVRHVRCGETVFIPKESKHSIKAITRLTFIEVQNGHPLIEEDIERTDWDFDNNVEIIKNR